MQVASAGEYIDSSFRLWLCVERASWGGPGGGLCACKLFTAPETPTSPSSRPYWRTG